MNPIFVEALKGVVPIELLVKPAEKKFVAQDYSSVKAPAEVAAILNPPAAPEKKPTNKEN